MSRLEGRIALGLDEFMLRLGHLSVLLSLPTATTPNRDRLSRKLGEILAAPRRVDERSLEDVGAYLAAKELARVAFPGGSTKAARPGARYESLSVVMNEDGRAAQVLDGAGQAEPTVWFQDLAIADRRTPSKVGAVTTDRERVSNKTGVSHLIDWAISLGLLNARLGLTAMGKALSRLPRMELVQGQQVEKVNPYVLGAERVFYLWLLSIADGDVLQRLVGPLCAATEIQKRDAIAMAVQLASDVEQEAAHVGSAESQTARKASRTLREQLGLIGSRRPLTGGRPPAIVWHRIASRLEMLTDLGFLTKEDLKGSARHFDYYYRATPALFAARASLPRYDSIVAWAESCTSELVAAGLGQQLSTSPCTEELFHAAQLCFGPTGIHIDAFAVTASTLSLDNGKHLSIAEARRSIEELARQRPDIARLSRGYSGSRAELASIIMSKLDDAGPSAFEPH